jgi:hypothetical protein
MVQEHVAHRCARDWLVGEPGPWKPARSVLESNIEATVLPSPKPLQGPDGNDASCFELKLPKGVSSLGGARDHHRRRDQRSHGVSRAILAPTRTRGLVGGGVARARWGRGERALGDVRLTYLSAAEFGRRAGAFKPRS